MSESAILVNFRPDRGARDREPLGGDKVQTVATAQLVARACAHARTRVAPERTYLDAAIGAGGAAMRANHPLELRDVETALTHKMVADRVVPAAARAVLGLGNPPPDL